MDKISKAPYVACMELAVEDFRTTTDYEHRKLLGKLIRTLSELCRTDIPVSVQVWFESREASRGRGVTTKPDRYHRE